MLELGHGKWGAGAVRTSASLSGSESGASSAASLSTGTIAFVGGGCTAWVPWTCSPAPEGLGILRNSSCSSPVPYQRRVDERDECNVAVYYVVSNAMITDALVRCERCGAPVDGNALRAS